MMAWSIPNNISYLCLTHTRNIQTYLLTLLWQTPTDTYLLNNEKKWK